jgi:hypothetical protein
MNVNQAMHISYFHKTAPLLLAAMIFTTAAPAQNLDQIGVTLLRVMATNVDGTGIRVAQPEAELSVTPPEWEVNPANQGLPASLFTYFQSNTAATTYPNSLGTNSSHADEVGTNFYRVPSGVATNVAHVDNYEADYFYDSVIAVDFPTNINDSVVNQSFTFGVLSADVQEEVDSIYDDYTAEFGTLFVSAVDNYSNSHQVCAPGTAYNSIGVAAYGGDSSVGPTGDNGRCKPDITAPAGATSFSTPQVAGAAAALMGAALRGDGGSDTNSAYDLRTIKALLLNGAVKPLGWTNAALTPLDARYGAGLLNVFNSYEQLTGGKQGNIETTLVPTGGAHPPAGATGAVSVLSGWDFNTNSSSPADDAINHYYFNVTNGGTATFAATATLVWNRQYNQTNINNLALFLYRCANSNLVACSTSLVDNVQHVFDPALAPGRYDLQVWQAGGANTVSANETYALAWAFVAPTLSLTPAGTNATLSWPVYPAGFLVQTTTNLAAPVWTTFNLSNAVLTNRLNALAVPTTNSPQFFRLRQPNF